MDDRPPARAGRGQNPAYMPTRPLCRGECPPVWAGIPHAFVGASPVRDVLFVCGCWITIGWSCEGGWDEAVEPNGPTSGRDVVNTPLRVLLGQMSDFVDG